MIDTINFFYQIQTHYNIIKNIIFSVLKCYTINFLKNNNNINN